MVDVSRGRDSVQYQLKLRCSVAVPKQKWRCIYLWGWVLNIQWTLKIKIFVKLYKLCRTQHLNLLYLHPWKVSERSRHWNSSRVSERLGVKVVVVHPDSCSWSTLTTLVHVFTNVLGFSTGLPGILTTKTITLLGRTRGPGGIFLFTL